MSDVRSAVAADHRGMLMTGSLAIDAERAFSRAVRARRRAALKRLLKRACPALGRLEVYDERKLGRAGAAARRGVREIPLDAIGGTVEPSRARLFDHDFRPAPSACVRWQRLWQAEQRGAVLPPISVVRVGDEFAVRDGHHRVSVARARGALAIDATVDLAA
jgi:hypothetical protein